MTDVMEPGPGEDPKISPGGVEASDNAQGASASGTAIPPEEAMRAEFYDFLAALLRCAPSRGQLRAAAELEAGAGPIGEAAQSLARVAGSLAVEDVKKEFHDLFVGVGRGELMPYASFYMTGFLNEKPLAKLREDMSRLRIERADGVFEPEDNIASLCEMMAGLIRGRFGRPVAFDEQRTFFFTHLGPWAPHFFSDLEGAKRSVFYAPVGTLGRLFMEVEREAFRMEGESSE